MIRPLTCICMLMAAGAGLYLYQTKHRAQLLDREIAHTYDQIEQTKKRIGVLKGEWAVMNEPERLADLARQHLNLRTLAPTQFVAMADIGNRLPAPLPPGSIIVPVPEEAPAPTQNTPANIPVAAAKPAPIAAPSKVTPPAAPVQVASLPQPPAPIPPRPAPRPAIPAALPAPATLPAPVPRLTAPIVNVSAPPVQTMRAAPQPTPSILPATMASPPAPAPSRYVAAATVTPSFGSALGSTGHIALPAPVPYAASAR